ncbi:hypothetical protein ACFRCW_31800 [Streptomyces sp. NPDC056653]|uniref:hypothetical protein n=1 Tax=Streptomyces sp. NPDC056653 TaxID=3345894 RepID=UPI0036AD5557
MWETEEFGSNTDAAAAAATTGAPVVSVSGARIGLDRTTGQPKPLALAPGASSNSPTAGAWTS